MGKRRTDRNCVEMNICVDPDLEKEIIKYKHLVIATTGKSTYWKNDAASDLFRDLFAKEQERKSKEGQHE